MDSQTLMELKQMIEQRRDDLLDAVREHLLKDGALSEAFNAGEPQGDEGDQSVSDTTMEFMLRRGVREGQDLAAAQRALDRIVRGEYGVCVDCSKVGEIIFMKSIFKTSITFCFAPH